MRISRHVVVLNQGRMLAEGTPEEVRTNPEVIAAYLGTHGAKEASLA
jgi:branched-chain amino acid transport system ATP-binding protein